MFDFVVTIISGSVLKCFQDVLYTGVETVCTIMSLTLGRIYHHAGHFSHKYSAPC